MTDKHESVVDRFASARGAIASFIIAVVCLFLGGAIAGAVYQSGILFEWDEYHYTGSIIRAAADSGLIMLMLAWPTPFLATAVFLGWCRWGGSGE